MMAEFADKQAEWVDPVLAEITRHIMIGWRHSRLFIKMWFKFILTKQEAQYMKKQK